MEKKYKLGYTSGVFDLFHIGHLNILRKAKEECEYLIVGVSSDELTIRLKGNPPVISYEQRIEIVKSIRYVDCAICEESVDKYDAWMRFHYDALFKGSDAAMKECYKEYEKKLRQEGVDVVYFPYTDGISSSKIRKRIC